jgi:hypothetical protein
VNGSISANQASSLGLSESSSSVDNSLNQVNASISANQTSSLRLSDSSSSIDPLLNIVNESISTNQTSSLSLSNSSSSVDSLLNIVNASINTEQTSSLNLSNSSSSVDNSLNLVNADISTNQTSSIALSNSSASVDNSLNLVNASVSANQTSSVSLSSSSSSIDNLLNIVNTSISTNQTSSLNLSTSSSSVDFELADLSLKIESASLRIISLSSQSSEAGDDIREGETIAGYVESLEEPQRLIRKFLSALELDYSDDLAAELSDKRIMNRLSELQGLMTGVSQATEVVSQIAQARENALADRDRSLRLPRNDSAESSTNAFATQLLRAIQERFGSFNPNDLTYLTTTTSSGSLNPFAPRTGISSSQSAMDVGARMNIRTISSTDALIREFNKDTPLGRKK